MEKVRHIKLFRSYFKDFYVEQTQTVRDKINFVQKSQKTPPKEIKKAEVIKKEYFKSKEDK